MFNIFKKKQYNEEVKDIEYKLNELQQNLKKQRIIIENLIKNKEL